MATTVGVAGELLLTMGILVLLYVVYVLWGTGIQTERAQDELHEQMVDGWNDPAAAEGAEPPVAAAAETPLDPAEADIGEGYALLRIPALGEDWEWVVVQGVELSDLARGPGHYEDTADPGELGNVAIAAHRSGHGAPFADLDRIGTGDVVEVQTAAGTWTYTIDEPARVIEPNDTWVVDPVPGQSADAEPTERRITLTTCHPRYGASQRMYVSGVLTDGEEI
ncbi:MAG TPA: class E sortase [Jiangellaceae bacterium]|nr:class E sortase [Jiangellaceae bacterium]